MGKYFIHKVNKTYKFLLINFGNYKKLNAVKKKYSSSSLQTKRTVMIEMVNLSKTQKKIIVEFHE